MLHYFSPQRAGLTRRQAALIFTAALLAGISPAGAATLTWDASASTSGPQDGSGNWLSANSWWNGSASVNWVNGSDAIFGSGNSTSGTYAVTNNSALVLADFLTFTNPGSYTITMDGVNAGEVEWTNVGGGIASVSRGVWVGTNINACLNVPWTDLNGSDIFLGSNSVLTFAQGTFQNQGTLIFKGSGAAISTVNVTNGVWGGPTGAQLPNTTDLCGTTLNLMDTAVINTGTRFDIGRSGVTGAFGSDGIVNVANGGRFNVNANASTDPNANLQISRGGPGTLNVLPGGWVNTLTDGSSGRLLLIPDSGSQATVNISGGTLNVGVGAGGLTGVNNSLLNLITLMQGSMSYGSSASAVLNLSGGTLTAQGIQIGSTNGTFTSNPTNQINVTGGTLYLGAANFSQPKSTGTKFALNLSGGTVAATANWSPACTVPINLTNLNGDITFQTADANGTPFDISLAGTLTGIGGLKQAGGGTLTLGGTNTYTGVTAINGGTVLISGGGAIAASSSLSLTNGGALVLLNGAAGNKNNRVGNAAPIAMNGGAFDFINDGSVAGFSEAAGALTINAGVNVVTVFPATNGQTSALTFSSLVNNGSVDFQTSAAGTAQNKILFTTPPTLDSGITVNGRMAAYDSINGLYDTTIYTNIAALGSVISNAPAGDVRINSVGSGGNIALDSATTAINSLQQNTVTPAVVDTANKTFSVNQITVNAGAQPLFIGATPGSGVLSAGSMGGNLILANNDGLAPGLIINAVVADNVFPSSLTVSGGGTVTLAAPNNTYSGSTTINNGMLVVTTGTTVAMPYTNNGGTLAVNLGATGTTLPMNGFTLGGNSPQLMFNLNGMPAAASPVINVNGNLVLGGNVYVNVTNPAPGTTVLLQYSGSRTGPGRFVPGNLPPGVGIIDDPTSREISLIYFSGPTVVIPPHNPNEIVVAIATPQQYGAAGDGVTDDSAAFQSALNAVNNAGGVGGGVVYVPSGTYAFSNNLIIPPGVTLQGDWTDWSQGTNGVEGVLFKVYVGAGQSNGTPFITMNQSALKGVSIWYPNQDPANITPYPFTISLENSDPVVQDVALINSYQGIEGSGAAQHIISDVFGSPLYTGIQVDAEYDISHQDNVRFSPDFWPASQLPGAPAVGGPHAAWMRANGTAERLYRADGEACMDVAISGYNVGFYALPSVNGTPDVSFYGGYISNCATAYLDTTGGGNTGEEFTDFTLDGDVAVDRNSTNPAAAFFHTCQITGHSGMAIHQTGNSSSVMQFQNCTISGTVKEDGGIANFVNSSFTVPAGSNHCVMASGAIYAAFTGCTFTPARSISNAADARRLVIDGRRASTSPLPLVNWADIQNDWLTRRPAKLDLFFATNAVGDGVADDTAAIQSALTAAGANGGGIVYLPAGKYKLTGTLDVPSGVELLGSFPSRHSASLYDGHVKVTVLQPYGGAGTTNGPPAVALEANAGVVGLTVTYELQNTNATPYPPTIQGRGANVYAYGLLCPNAYWDVDLNTYTCTNHFLYQVDGWSIAYGFQIGNGSSGSLIECMANPSYWDGNTLSASVLGSATIPSAPIQNFAEHNLEWFWLGNCTELMAKNFDYLSHTFMHCVTQNGLGPRVTGILTMCDAAVECFRFESAANSLINIVNPEWMVTTADYSDLTGYGVIATTNFQGTARFFNAPLWGGRLWDYLIQGGDVGFELTHAGYLSTHGTEVDGGVLHMINSGWQGNTSSFYTVPFTSPSNGVPGKLSEIIGCYAWTGVTNSLANAGNPVNVWGNFGINHLTSQSVFNVTSPKLSFSSSPAAQTVSLTWSNNMGAFNLYSTPALASPAVWMPVTNTPYFATNLWTVIDSTTNAPQRFYRLQP
jgi:autotransporter-associated beta strand protein